MRSKLVPFCLIVWMLAALPLVAAAQDFHHALKGSISVTLVSPSSEQPMAGAELSVYHVATVRLNSKGELSYVAKEAFEDDSIALYDPDLLSKLDAFVSEHKIASRKIVTDAHGKGVCSDLTVGLYFVKQVGVVDGFAPCTSFLVTIPMKTDSGYLYDVDASPKTDVVRFADITVRKVWNTDRSTALPSNVTVQLLRNGAVIETAILSKQNDWQVTYTGLPESDGYSIEEVNVPKGYAATYTQGKNIFTVTNTASLAQTGQLIWPIPVLAMAGVFFLLVGSAILRKPEEHNA